MKEKTINKNFSFGVGPYSPGVKAGQYLFTSGQLCLDPRTGEVIEGGIETQYKQALENFKTLLESHSALLEDVVKVTVFLKIWMTLLGLIRSMLVILKKNYPPAVA